MTRDEFWKCAHEIRVALGHNYMEQLEEMVAAYEECTRWNEELRAELAEANFWWSRWESRARAIGALTSPATGFPWKGMPMKSCKGKQ
jgi:hypothetical protein